MSVRKARQGYKLVKSLFGKYEEIPEDWNVKQISSLGKIVTGSTPSTSIEEYYGDEFLWATPPDLESVKYINTTQTKLSKKGFTQTRKLPPKSVLVTCIGTIGRTGMAIQEMATNQQINSVIAINVDPEFLYYQLSHNHEKIKNMANQAVVPILNKTDFGTIKILIPENEKEQQKIASILSNVDSLIQQTQKIIEQTQRLKKGLMQKLLTKGIGHTKFKKVTFRFPFISSQIPESWQLLSLVAISQDGLKNGIFKKSEEFGAGVPLVNVTDLFAENEITLDKLEKVKVNDKELKQFGVKKGDIFFCRSSLVMDGIGRSNIITNLTGSAVFECHVMMLRPNELINHKFLFYFTRSQIFKKFLYAIAMTLTMTTIRQPDLELALIPVPLLKEQQKIASILSNVDFQIQKQQEYKSKLETLKKGLMQKLLTGQIRVNA